MWISLTPKERQMHECVLSILVAEGLVQKHQAIGIHSAN